MLTLALDCAPIPSEEVSLIAAIAPQSVHCPPSTFPYYSAIEQSVECVPRAGFLGYIDKSGIVQYYNDEGLTDQLDQAAPVILPLDTCRDDGSSYMDELSDDSDSLQMGYRLEISEGAKTISSSSIGYQITDL